MNKIKFYIGISIISAVIIFGLGWCSKPCPEIKTTESATQTVTKDTVKEYLPVYIDTGKVIVRYKIIDKSRIDTIVNPLIAGADTLDFPVKVASTNDLYLTTSFEMGYHNVSETTKDTHEVTFFWPDNKVIFKEFPAPREKIYEKVKETIRIELEKPLPWYKEDWVQWGFTGLAFIGGVYTGSQTGSNK